MRKKYDKVDGKLVNENKRQTLFYVGAALLKRGISVVSPHPYLLSCFLEEAGGLRLRTGKVVYLNILFSSFRKINGRN